jgi:hypothetical protein
LFDQPYEPRSSGEPPAWEKSPASSVSVGKGLSSYIKPKKKVAALFGAKRAPVAEATETAES